MVEIRHEGVANAPLSVAFAYVDDYRTTPTWLFGLNKFKPLDPGRTQGLGAVYDAKFVVRPVSITSRVEISEWAQDELIEIKSISGFTNSSSWAFTADGPDRTVIRVRFTYELPGGLAGKALGKALEPIAAISVKRSDAALRKNIEAAAAKHA